jgi:hypothetical protein
MIDILIQITKALIAAVTCWTIAVVSYDVYKACKPSVMDRDKPKHTGLQ